MCSNVDHEDLFLQPPLPIACVTWDKCWATSVPEYAKSLAVLRTGAMIQLCTMPHTNVHACDALRKYAIGIADMLNRTNIRQHSSHRRSIPLEFVWCFPAEQIKTSHLQKCTMQTKCENTAVLRSTYPAIEAMCCMIASSCILYAKFVHLTEQNRNASLVAKQLLADLELMQSWSATKPKAIFSSSQWQRMCHKILPLQLHNFWPMYMQQRVRHQIQLKHILHASAQQNLSSDLAAYTRGAAQTAARQHLVLRLWVCAWWPSVSQIMTLEELYNHSLCDLIKLQSQVLMLNIKQSMKHADTQTHTAVLIIQLREKWTALKVLGHEVDVQMENWLATVQRVQFECINKKADKTLANKWQLTLSCKVQTE